MKELMVQIEFVTSQWKEKTITSQKAVQTIEKLILDNQKAEWSREHQGV